jgi:hypothetical protein
MQQIVGSLQRWLQPLHHYVLHLHHYVLVTVTTMNIVSRNNKIMHLDYRCIMCTLGSQIHWFSYHFSKIIYKGAIKEGHIIPGNQMWKGYKKKRTYLRSNSVRAVRQDSDAAIAFPPSVSSWFWLIHTHIILSISIRTTSLIWKHTQKDQA